MENRMVGCPKRMFLLVMGGTPIFIYLLLTFLPFIDPLKKKIEIKFKNVLFLRDAMLVFFAVIFSLGIEAAREGSLNMDLFGFAFGLLLIVIGNYMPKMPQNWFLGIRTPWTISSEVVWKKTHILGGWLFMVSGVIYLIWTALKVSERPSALCHCRFHFDKRRVFVFSLQESSEA